MKNLNNQKSCCQESDSKKEGKGVLAGVLYGLAPHTFCILFIIFTVLGVTTATTLLKPLLLNPYFFYLLIALSLVFATISAIIYLKKNGILSLRGIKKKWKYLSILYGTTVSVNLILFMVIFPFAANINQKSTLSASLSGPFNQIESSQSFLTLEVNIPCPGHAPLITTELKKIDGVENVKFGFPNKFKVSYDSTKTSKEQILSLKVFETYKATVIEEITKLDKQSKSFITEQPLSNTSGSRGGCTSCGGGGCGCGCGR